jgi:3-oxoacyl-[acyl-carrier protein] reductase
MKLSPNDISVGDSQYFFHTVRKAEIDAFALLSGDDNPLHIDREFSQRQGNKDVVGHGMLTMALVSRLIGTRLPGRGSTWTNQQFEFLSAVYPDDTLKISGTVLKVFQNRAIVEMEFLVENQNKKKILQGVGNVKVPEGDPFSAEKEKLEFNAESPTSAIVIGASGSLGLDIFEKLAKRGISTIGTFRSSPNELENHVEKFSQNGLKCSTIKFDSALPESLGDLTEQIRNLTHPPTILVNCSSLPPSGVKVTDLYYESLEAQFKSEIFGLLEIFKLLQAGMIKNQFGRVISIGSTATIGRAEIGWSAYLMAKSASAQLIKSIAAENGAYGITANTITPGLSRQGMGAYFPKQATLVAQAETPSHRLVNHEDVADLVEFLALGSSQSINGHEFVIDAGRTMS